MTRNKEMTSADYVKAAFKAFGYPHFCYENKFYNFSISVIKEASEVSGLSWGFTNKKTGTSTIHHGPSPTTKAFLREIIGAIKKSLMPPKQKSAALVFVRRHL